MRVKQRIYFFIQWLVALGTLMTMSFNRNFEGAGWAIWLAPWATIYFARLVFINYRVTNRLNRFLRDHIEVELARILDIDEKNLYCYFWGNYSEYSNKYGRIITESTRWLFHFALWVTPLCCLYLFSTTSTCSPDDVERAKNLGRCLMQCQFSAVFNEYLGILAAFMLALLPQIFGLYFFFRDVIANKKEKELSERGKRTKVVY